MGQEEMVTKQKPKAPPWLIENIAEASKNARKIYFLYIGFLAYCALTVISTSDRQIILNETASLPFLRLEVPLNGFFIIAPLIAMLVFIYFQLYLHRLKALIDDLRINYASIEKRRLYPWMINIAEDPDSGFIGKLQGIMVKFSLWILLPLVLILIAIWFIKKHDPFLSYIVGISPILGAFFVLFFWCQYEDTKMKEFFRRNLEAIFIYIVFFIISYFLIDLGLAYIITLFYPFSMPSMLYLLVGVAFIVVCSLLRYLYLKLRGISWKNEGKTVLVSSVFTFGVLLIFIIIPHSNKGSFISVDLSHQKLVTEPQKDYEGLFWGNFEKIHLEGANLSSSILKRVDLRYAHLQHARMVLAILQKANLRGANLRDANLRGANLQEAHLEDANLRDANLRGANLRDAYLMGANFQKANLGDANLRDAYLRVANLQDAYLGDANLRDAYLRGANLQGANILEADFIGAKGLTKDQLKSARNWLIAFYSEEQIEVLELPKDHNNNVSNKNLSKYPLQGSYLPLFNLQGAKLIQTNLQEANLKGANLWEADLSGADLSGAELHNAWLRAADLRGAKGLTVEQLSNVSTLYEAKLDSKLMEQLKKDYPRLLEKRKRKLRK